MPERDPRRLLRRPVLQSGGHLVAELDQAADHQTLLVDIPTVAAIWSLVDARRPAKSIL